MTWVKICGMTNLEDALVAVDAGADAVGFVFYEKSPRYVTVETAREIVEKLPESVEKVGVFVGSEADEVSQAVSESGLTAAQIYQDTAKGLNDEYFRKLSCRAIPAISATRYLENAVGGFWISNGMMRERVIAMLIDSGNAALPGGTGEKFEWGDLSFVSTRIGINMIVAGGLTPSNVAEAMSVMKPWGVDVASGVEASPGKKDSEKVRAFVRAVREMDRKVS